MERTINIHIEKLPERVCLATSDDIQGLVAQGLTATEALAIARDVARKLIEAQRERSRWHWAGLILERLTSKQKRGGDPPPASVS